jgi:hypothetical protein
MHSLLYKTKREILNSVKKSIKKPATLWIALVIMLNLTWMYSWFVSLIRDMDSMLFNRYLSFFSMALLVVLNFTMGINKIAKQRALLFDTADGNFIFTSPISPKLVLLNAYSKIMMQSLVIYFVILILLYTMNFTLGTILIVAMSLIILDICELLLVIIIYGKHGESDISKYARYFVRSVIAFFGIYLLYLYFIRNIGFNITQLIDNPFIFLLPFVGWGMSIFYVIFIQPTMITIIGSFLLYISVALLAVYAWRLSSQGEFYEEATTFAEEYEVVKKRAKSGEVSLSWKKKKLRKASVVYKGTGATALLYRQILEYKKQPFFIFGFKSVVNLIISLAGAYLVINNPRLVHIGIPLPYIFIFAMIYLSFTSSGYLNKWIKEIGMIYTFLIPDTAFRKLWHATCIEHIRFIVDGVLLVVPAGIVCQLSVLEMIGCIGVYAVIESTKLYTQMICQTILRSYVGKTIAFILVTLFQGMVYFLAYLIILLLSNILSITMLLYVLVMYGIMVVVVLCILSSGQFERMESVE